MVEVSSKGGFPAYITAAIPCFLLMILAEFLLTMVYKLPSKGGRYALADAWSSLTAGTVQQLVSTLVLKPLLINTLPYSMIHERFAVPNGLALPVDSPWTWVAALVLADLAYYWLHRFAHEINIRETPPPDAHVCAFFCSGTIWI